MTTASEIDRQPQILYSVYLPKDLVRRADHLRIDLGLRSRRELVEHLIRCALDDGETSPDAE